MANSWGLGSVFVARAETASDFSDDDKNCCCKKSHAHTFQLLGNRISATDGNREENREPSRRLTNSFSTNFTQYDREGGQQRTAFASTAPQETQKNTQRGRGFFPPSFLRSTLFLVPWGNFFFSWGEPTFFSSRFFSSKPGFTVKTIPVGGVSLNLSTGANDANKVGQLGFLLPRNAPQNRRTHYQKIYIPGKKNLHPLFLTHTLSRTEEQEDSTHAIFFTPQKNEIPSSECWESFSLPHGTEQMTDRGQTPDGHGNATT